MRENRKSGSDGGEAQTNGPSLPPKTTYKACAKFLKKCAEKETLLPTL